MPLAHNVDDHLLQQAATFLQHAGQLHTSLLFPNEPCHMAVQLWHKTDSVASPNAALPIPAQSGSKLVSESYCCYLLAVSKLSNWCVLGPSTANGSEKFAFHKIIPARAPRKAKSSHFKSFQNSA